MAHIELSNARKTGFLSSLSTCCGCCSLKAGVITFAILELLFSADYLKQSSSVGLFVLQLVFSAVGVYGAHQRDLGFLSAYWWFEAVMSCLYSAAVVAVSVMMGIAGGHKEEGLDKAGKEAQAAGAFLGVMFLAMFLVYFFIMALVHVYNLSLTGSLYAVVAAGGSGEEKRNAEEIAESKPLMSDTKAVSAPINTV